MADSASIDPRFAGETPSMKNPPRIDGVIITPLTANVDDRQRLTVYLKASDTHFRGFAQSYVSISSQGVVKAWHYHLKQTDIWYVASGKIKVGLFDARADSPTNGIVNEVIMGGGDEIALTIPPGVFHGYVALTSEAMLINTTDQPYDTKDEFRAAWDDPRFGFNWGIENR